MKELYRLIWEAIIRGRGQSRGRRGRNSYRGPPRGYRGGPAYGYRGGPAQGYRGGPAQGYRGGPPCGYRGGPARGYRGGSAQGYRGGPARGYRGGSAQGYRGGPARGYRGGPAYGYRGGSAYGYRGGAVSGYPFGFCHGGYVGHGGFHANGPRGRGLDYRCSDGECGTEAEVEEEDEDNNSELSDTAELAEIEKNITLRKELYDKEKTKSRAQVAPPFQTAQTPAIAPQGNIPMRKEPSVKEKTKSTAQVAPPSQTAQTSAIAPQGNIILRKELSDKEKTSTAQVAPPSQTAQTPAIAPQGTRTPTMAKAKPQSTGGGANTNNDSHNPDSTINNADQTDNPDSTTNNADQTSKNNPPAKLVLLQNVAGYVDSTIYYIKSFAENKCKKGYLSYTNDTQNITDYLAHRVATNSISKSRFLAVMCDVPFKCDKGERMLRQMGWKGGALGLRGEGTTETIIPAMPPTPVRIKKLETTQNVYEFDHQFLSNILSFLRMEENETTLLEYSECLDWKRVCVVDRTMKVLKQELSWRFKKDDRKRLLEEVFEEMRKQGRQVEASVWSPYNRKITLTKAPLTVMILNTDVKKHKNYPVSTSNNPNSTINNADQAKKAMAKLKELLFYRWGAGAGCKPVAKLITSQSAASDDVEPAIGICAKYFLMTGRKSAYTENITDCLAQRVAINNIEECRILAVMCDVPFKCDKGERMMRQMGWQGGALGLRGEGTTETIIPAQPLTPVHIMKQYQTSQTRDEFCPQFLEDVLSFLRAEENETTIEYAECLERTIVSFVKSTIQKLKLELRLKRDNIKPDMKKFLEDVFERMSKQGIKQVDACFSRPYNRKITLRKVPLTEPLLASDQNTSINPKIISNNPDSTSNNPDSTSNNPDLTSSTLNLTPNNLDSTSNNPDSTSNNLDSTSTNQDSTVNNQDATLIYSQNRPVIQNADSLNGCVTETITENHVIAVKDHFNLDSSVQTPRCAKTLAYKLICLTKIHLFIQMDDEKRRYMFECIFSSEIKAYVSTVIMNVNRKMTSQFESDLECVMYDDIRRATPAGCCLNVVIEDQNFTLHKKFCQKSDIPPLLSTVLKNNIRHQNKRIFSNGAIHGNHDDIILIEKKIDVIVIHDDENNETEVGSGTVTVKTEKTGERSIDFNTEDSLDNSLICTEIPQNFTKTDIVDMELESDIKELVKEIIDFTCKDYETAEENFRALGMELEINNKNGNSLITGSKPNMLFRDRVEPKEESVDIFEINEMHSQDETAPETDLFEHCIDRSPANGKRSRSSSITTEPEPVSKKCKSQIRSVRITCKEPNKVLNTDVIRNVQSVISESIDVIIDNVDFLPRLECHGVKNGGLIYSCHDDKTFAWMTNFVTSDLDLNITETDYPSKTNLEIKIYSFEDVNKIFNRLMLYNPDLDTTLWRVIDKKEFEDFVIITVEIDKESFDIVNRHNYSLYAGIDKAKFT